MLERWSSRIDWTKLLNKQSLTWRKVPEVDRLDISKDDAMALIIENPTLLKRPVLESGDFIAVDNTQAGIGDTVLVNREGNGARATLNLPDGCIISVIVGIVDSLYVE